MKSALGRLHRIATDSLRLLSDLAPMPFKVLEALAKHPLTDAGFKRSKEDWGEAKPHLGELLPSMQEA